MQNYAVADPGFPRREGVEAPTPEFWPQNLLFDKVFTENCMNMKHIGRRGGECP